MTMSKEDYVDIFLKEVSTKAKDGKTIYIQPEFHKKLTRIVQVIGENKASVYTYLHNLLEDDFNEFEQQIKRVLMKRINLSFKYFIKTKASTSCY